MVVLLKVRIASALELMCRELRFWSGFGYGVHQRCRPRTAVHLCSALCLVLHPFTFSGSEDSVKEDDALVLCEHDYYNACSHILLANRTMCMLSPDFTPDSPT